MEDKKVTLQDIADEAHVSKALVSRVLNNRPVRVSQQKRDQILRIANEKDYLPSGKIISNTAPVLDKTIALILPHLDYSFMSVIADTITSIAYENGYSVMVFDGKNDSSLEMRYLDLCQTLKVSGIILDSFHSANNKKHIEKLNNWGIPYIFIDCYPNDENVSFVSSYNRDGSYRLTESLILRGHHNILSIIKDKSTLTNVSLERLNGYFAAMDKYGLTGYNEIIYPDREYNMQPIYTIMNSSIEFSAFIIHTASDVKHFCKLLPYTKYSSGKDYEIGIFDDFQIATSDYLTGNDMNVYNRIVSVIAQRPKEIATQAINTLLTHIKKKDSFQPEHTFVKCDLYEKRSK